MSEMYYESGEFISNSVRVKVFNEDGNNAVLNVGGVQTFTYIKPEELLAITNAQELYDLILKKICFEELEGTLDEEPTDYSLGGILEYLKTIDENADSPVLKELRHAEGNVKRFYNELNKSITGKITKVIVHQYHNASGDMCDFEDYLNIPYGEEEDAMREYLESTLTPDSEIDNIMEHFEDGDLYINAYQSDEELTVDITNNKVDKTLTVIGVN